MRRIAAALTAALGVGFVLFTLEAIHLNALDEVRVFITLACFSTLGFVGIVYRGDKGE
ncbi:MAG TPA: hypothetical protein VNG90_02870 [Candidatus Acidoferrum sp.]|nr:hypothetical protein [Candidatus Acidoferrum sp.]